MTDSELDQKLNAARTPSLEPDYTADFPRTVLVKIRTASPVKDLPRRRWLPRMAWSAGFALFFLMAGFGLGHWHGKTAAPGNDLLANAKMIQETLTLFPHRVRAIMQDKDEMRLILADGADVPDSPPLFVKICNGKKCSSIVTFSGQEIEVAGQPVTVLADAGGGIILEGEKFVWSSRGENSSTAGLKIEARHLSSPKL